MTFGGGLEVTRQGGAAGAAGYENRRAEIAGVLQKEGR
jgi:hypothetical protein